MGDWSVLMLPANARLPTCVCRNIASFPLTVVRAEVQIKTFLDRCPDETWADLSSLLPPHYHV